MGKTLKVFANYGVLAKEKRTVYTVYAPHEGTTGSEGMTVELPEGWDWYENTAGQTVLTTPWGAPYMPNEVIGGNKFPSFIAYEDGKRRTYKLKIIKD
ncbi:hypothetical protein LJC61_09360 [Ruminococcaceae bacterium OttesenSCG-928-A16]|nr:hypothetical protein [Ruminococcaceae bacterium OttesenSCG-928-A16]